MANEQPCSDFDDTCCHSDDESDLFPYDLDNLDPSFHIILRDGDPLRYFSNLDLESQPNRYLSHIIPRENKYEGYLEKQGGVHANQGWRRRYMVFDGQSLKYYVSPRAPVSLRIIPVSSMRNVSQLSLGKLNRFQLSLECTHRTFLFATDDLTACQTWASYLMEAIIKYKKQHGDTAPDGGIMASPDISGVVRFKNKKYFAALKDDTFRYYGNEEDFRSDSPIHELSMSLVSVSNVSPTSIRITSTPGEPPLVLSFDNDQDCTSWKTALEHSIFEAHGDNTIVDQISSIEGNDTCADCTSTKTHWAVLNLCIVLCPRCAGVHRSLGVTRSKVRSLRMDNIFQQNQLLVQLFGVIGNRRANEFWNHKSPGDVIDKMASDAVRRRHIHHKYIDKGLADMFEYESEEQLQQVLMEAVMEGNILTSMRLLYSGGDLHRSCDAYDGKNAIQLADSLGHDLLLEFLKQNENIEMTSKRESPKLLHQNTRSIYLENHLEKTGPNLKGFLKRWCVLNNNTITYYADKTGKCVEKGCLEVKDILTVSKASCNERLHCFDFSVKEKRRIYRFAAEDGGVRDDWMRALIQTVQPQGIQDLPLDQEIQFAGQIYARQKNSSWYLGWMTLIGHVLRIENLTCRSSLVVDMGQVFMVYTHHKGKCKALDLSPSDSKILEDNQRTEVLVDDRILMLQGIMLRDTEKIFTLLDELVKAR